MKIGNLRFEFENCYIFVLALMLIYLAIVFIFLCPSVFAYSAEDMRDFQNADNLRAEGKVQDAIDIYEKILKRSPDTDLKGEILVQMASCYIQLGDDDSAIKSYLRLISSDPNSMDASNAVSLMSNMFMQRYQYDDLIAILKQIIQQFPQTESSAMASYRIANYLYSKGDNENAINEYKNFLVQYPKSIMRLSAINRLTYLYISESMFKEAESIIKASLEENPNNTYAMNQLGLVYRKQGRYDDALELYKNILANNPKDPDVYEQLGEIYFEKGEKDKAIAEWNKITELNPGQYYYHQMLAGIFKSHDYYEQAVQEYQKAIDLQPMASFIYRNLAELHIVNKQYESAMNVYLNALMTLPVSYPDRLDIVENILEIIKIDGLYDKVVSTLRLRIEQSSNAIPALSALADIFFYNNEIDKSIELYKKLASISAENGKILLDRAERLKRERQLENAIKIYETIVDVYPNANISIDALISIGQLNFESNKPNEAIINLKSAIFKTKNNVTLYNKRISALILLGDVYLKQLRDTQYALSVYKEAEAILNYQDGFVEIPELYMKIADCYRVMGIYDMALKSLDLISDNYKSPSVSARMAKLLGDCYFSMGDFDNAKTQYKNAVKGNLKENWANDALDRLVLIDEYSGEKEQELLKAYANIDRMKEAGEDDQALIEYQNLIKAYPSSRLIDKVKMEIGELLSDKARYVDAIGVYEGLINSNSQFSPEAQYRIAGIYLYKLNDNQKAIDAYTKLIRNYPDSILVSDARKQLQIISTEALSPKKTS